MATEAEVILEDDHTYVAVTAPGGLAEAGAVCALEIGQHHLCPDDPEAQILPVCADGARNLIAALQRLLEQKDEVG